MLFASLFYATLIAILTLVAMQIDSKLFDNKYSNQTRAKVMLLSGFVAFATMHWVDKSLLNELVSSNMVEEFDEPMLTDEWL